MGRRVELVSVVIPTYNAAKWIVETIDNLIGQTYSQFELIVVDDGSQDDTVSVVREILRKSFKNGFQILELGSNKGPSAARNIGLKAANGSWVQFLDSDDLIAPNKFERQMAYCASAPSDVAAVYSPWRRCYLDEGRITWEGPLVKPDMVRKEPIMCLAAACRPLHSAGLARRKVLESIGGFDESLRFWECEEINVRIAKAGRLEPVHSDDPLYIWRLHRDKAYLGGEGARYRSVDVALAWIEQVLKETGHRSFDEIKLPPADRKHLLDDCTLWARLLYSHDRQAFAEFLKLARKLDPNIAPTYPRYVSFASRGIGYEKAEAVAKLGRMPKTYARKALQSLKLRPKTSFFDWN